MSNKMEKDEFGKRMKAAEKKAENYLDISKPIVVRIDGKRFSRFTKGYMKPFDFRLSTCMVNTMSFLLKDTHANVGYTQSDEITLIYLPKLDSNVCKIQFDGRIQKTVSIFASKATACFIREYDFIQKSVEDLREGSPFYVEGAKEFEKYVTPTFDCRIFNVDSEGEASNQLLWRIQDAMKNSISCVFRHRIGHKEMHNLSGIQMIEKMKSYGIDFNKEYTSYERSGSILKKTNSVTLSGDTITAMSFMDGLTYRNKNFQERVEYLRDKYI